MKAFLCASDATDHHPVEPVAAVRAWVDFTAIEEVQVVGAVEIDRRGRPIVPEPTAVDN